MAFCPEHPKRDQIMKFIPLSDTTSIPASMGVPPRPSGNVQTVPNVTIL